MKRYIFKRSGFLQRNATYWKGILFLLKECYTLWMKVSVCKACSCHLELVKRRMHVWSSLVVIYSVFTAFFRFGEKTQSWMIFFMWVESLLKGNFAERLRYFEVRKLYDIVWKGYELSLKNKMNTLCQSNVAFSWRNAPPCLRSVSLLSMENCKNAMLHYNSFGTIIVSSEYCID